LTIRNGGLTLKKATYEVIDLNEENFIPNQYYVYEPSGYVLAEGYSES
jgi:hypothetical protein